MNRLMDVPWPTQVSVVSVDILGVRVHSVTMREAVGCVRALIRGGGVHLVATVNGAMLVEAQRNPGAKALLNTATLATADGMGVLVAGRILRAHFPQRVPGIDLVEALSAMAAAEGLRLFLLGAEPGVVETAAATLRERYPGLQIVGTHHGYLGEGRDAESLAQIQAARPHLLFVGMGWPRQEEWIHAHRDALGSVVGVGVGGTFDVLAGRAQRAPTWMRQAGLEWVYRGISEPRRWRVIATLPSLLWFALRARMEQRRLAR